MNEHSNYKAICWLAGIAIVMALIFSSQVESYKYKDCLRETANYPDGGGSWADFCKKNSQHKSADEARYGN